MIKKKTIVISAINIFEGGPLTILRECLVSAVDCLTAEYNVVAIVHNKNLLNIKGVYYIELPKSRKNYFYRLYYEYWVFNSLSLKYKPELWFSLHDMTPRVCAKKRAVYCHNPSPFYSANLKDWWYSPTVAMFSLFYKYLYRINISKNSNVVTQQHWMAEEFQRMYNIDNTKLLVAKPLSKNKKDLSSNDVIDYNKDVFSFFYAAFPRIFKNYEVIAEATKLLAQKIKVPFKVYLTLSGQENKYSKKIFEKYKHISQLNFIGLINRSEVEAYYAATDALIFPSKLETWGLPISEFVPYNKPMLLANLSYAYETAVGGQKVAFFSPDNAEELAVMMKRLIEKDHSFLSSVEEKESRFTSVYSWNDLFSHLLKDK